MHVISEKALREFWQKHADAKEPLRSWLTAAKRAKWQNLAEVRQTFNSADVAGTCTIFNIKGNAYRLVSKIYYPTEVLLIRVVLTHADYDKGRWKNDCEC